MSPDPLGGSVDYPQSLNRYSYVLNNPESLVDLFGFCVQFRERYVKRILRGECNCSNVAA